MLENDPNARISAKQALLHDFFLHPYDLTHSETEDNASIHEKLRNINSLVIIFFPIFKNPDIVDNLVLNK